ncbi:hypothetical protein ACWGJ2_02740 [Streptomyces sp. NPDC054796]
MTSSPPRAGKVYTARRLIETEQILAFAELTGDRAGHHVDTSCDPPLAHGLYVASLAGEVLAPFGYLGRRSTMEFIAPVHSGDTIEARLTIRRAVPAGPLGTSVEAEMVITNQNGTIVLRGTTAGLVPVPKTTRDALEVS